MIIELLDGTQIDIAEYSLAVEDYEIPSVEIEHTAVSVDGLDNQIVTQTRYAGRIIPVIFCYLARDYQDYTLLRNELNVLFVRKVPFYIIFKDEPNKRWLVRLANQFAPEKELETIGSVTVNFRCEKINAESVGTSLDLQNKGTWDAALWGFSSGIDYDTRYNYTFNSNSFVVKNIGNESVDPRESMLDIILKGTFSNQVKITNHTTGDVFIYNGSLTSTDELKLTGIRTIKNGVSALRNTNKKLLTLTPGDNQITVEGGTVSSIVFNFKFLYK